MRTEDGLPPSPQKRKRPSHLVVARILGPVGMRGEVKAEVLTDFPHRFSLLKTVYLGEELAPAVVEAHRFHGRRVILKLEGCENRDDAAGLKGKLVQVPAEEAIPLEEDEYYIYEIIGLEVWTIEGEFLGRVDEVLFTGSNDVYVVKDGHQEVLIPALSDVVTKVDTEEGRIEVRLMEGLR
ncbi:MAG: 16S rRNA processing protein RimM [Anaerolineae bacterium]|nr:16S rRNA processing protein RimM [Anaerolineae bacterium]NIO00100.1 16S rRNA processing protein RimM [Anaerolineae bacterium]NIQ80515.1 16S rRNA processing protein RimM [Anaerolineae bacterium]